jgi:hypothetical protein
VTDLLARIRSDIRACMVGLEPVVLEATLLEMKLAERDEERAVTLARGPSQRGRAGLTRPARPPTTRSRPLRLAS